MDYKSLLDYANISRVVCAMPLPYTREYEGLASGLKREFSDVPFYFAHMRGADIRVECLRNGIYDRRSSRAAAEEYASRPENGVKIAATLGEHSGCRIRSFAAAEIAAQWVESAWTAVLWTKSC